MGRAARVRVPRSSHADYRPAARRADPIDLLEGQSADRVPELIPIRYQRMTESPFRFYRGAAAIMAADLAGSPRSGFDAQLCGDAHLLNFRLLGSPERHLMFDINDFDETLPGPWEWDLKRLGASLVIAGRGNGFDDQERAAIVAATAASYRSSMRRFAGMTDLDVWYAHADVEALRAQYTGALAKAGRRRVTKLLEKARSHDNVQAASRLTEVVDGKLRIRCEAPLVIPVRDLLPAPERRRLTTSLEDILTGYRENLESDRQVLLGRYRLVDVARKVVGVGSVGTRCWIGLLIGRDEHDPLFIQFKEAGRSVLADHLPASEYDNQGHRVVAGQRLMQAASDIFLGWQRVTGIDGRRRDFYIRQLRDWKGIAPAEAMLPRGMTAFGVLCGATLARAHARSGDRIAISAYLGSGPSFDRALVGFAEAYADQNDKDHAALLEAIRINRVHAAG